MASPINTTGMDNLRHVRVNLWKRATDQDHWADGPVKNDEKILSEPSIFTHTFKPRKSDDDNPLIYKFTAQAQDENDPVLDIEPDYYKDKLQLEEGDLVLKKNAPVADAMRYMTEIDTFCVATDFPHISEATIKKMQKKQCIWAKKLGSPHKESLNNKPLRGTGSPLTLLEEQRDEGWVPVKYIENDPNSKMMDKYNKIELIERCSAVPRFILP